MQCDGHDTDIVLERRCSLLDRDGACRAYIDTRHAQDAVVGTGGLSPDPCLGLDQIVYLDGACLGAKSVSFTYLMVYEHVGQLIEPNRSAHSVFY
jgi:hypothetical protein